MRKGASGWLAKGLLLLLVASFGLWGIGGDMLGSSVGSDVIEVGDQTVSLGEFQREYRNRLNQVSAYFGRQITTEEAKQFGVTRSTIASMKTRLLEQERVRELHLGVTDDQVVSEIQTNPNFKNAAGNFDRLRFETLLRQNGYSEAEYVNILKDEIRRRQLMQTVSLYKDTAPAFAVDQLFNHYLEKRVATYVEVSDSTAGDAPTPTTEQLQAYIDENKDAFMAPEYRKAVFLYISPEDFTDQVNVTEEQIKAEYEARSSEFILPEKREVFQMIFDTEEQAQEATARLTGGSDFAAVASEMLQLTEADINLGSLTKTELLDELQEPVFATPAGGSTAPVKTILGWHILKVNKVEEGRTRPISEVKAELEKDIALRGAADIVYDKSIALQDEFAGGASIEEAANAIGVKAKTIDWTDANGLNLQGQPSNNLPALNEFTATLFSTETGVEAELKEAGTGIHYALEVTDIKAAAVKDLETVKDQVTEAWQANWLHEENQKQVTALLEKVKGGSSLESLGYAVKTTVPGTRTGKIAGLAPAAVDSLFSLKEGEFAMGENDSKNGYVIFTVREIVPADKSKDKAVYSQLTTELTEGMSRDLNEQYMSYLEKEIGFSVKTGLIEEYF
ncbi:SurA N-terminal domain-containing protein [Sneathiella limimaris]|uniref:SurA N-terminal domain-containing protein n=1 Tax=Sneathiella limimaris TaxID=1964213 RepID=UPI00146D2DD3|nr:SurA N-terminal domain-containing protein [Sneathiella limimaris]